MSTSVLKALPGKLDIKRLASGSQQAFSKPCLVNLISKDTHLVKSIYQVALSESIRLYMYPGSVGQGPLMNLNFLISPE